MTNGNQVPYTPDDEEHVVAYTSDGVLLTLGLHEPLSEDAVAIFLSALAESFLRMTDPDEADGHSTPTRPDPFEYLDKTLGALQAHLASDKRPPNVRPTRRAIAQSESLHHAFYEIVDQLSRYRKS